MAYQWGCRPIHTGRGTPHAHKLEHFSFDVASVQCGHPHSHRQVPFARVVLCFASRVLCGLGLWHVSVRWHVGGGGV